MPEKPGKWLKMSQNWVPKSIQLGGEQRSWPDPRPTESCFRNPTRRSFSWASDGKSCSTFTPFWTTSCWTSSSARRSCSASRNARKWWEASSACPSSVRIDAVRVRATVRSQNADKKARAAFVFGMGEKRANADDVGCFRAARKIASLTTRRQGRGPVRSGQRPVGQAG